MTGLFAALQDWWERRIILRDMRRRQADKSERDRFRARDLLDEALAAIELNDHNKGAALWANARENYPAEVRKIPLSLDVLLKLHRFDEAEELMREGRKRYPGEVYFAKGAALVALTRGDHDVALDRYAALRKQFPGLAQGYILGAQALIAQGRLGEADVLAAEAIKRFPEDIGGFLEYARMAVRREDWQEALRRWQIVDDAFKDRVFGPLGRAQALVRLGRCDEADEVIKAARVLFPFESALLAEAARCAQARGDIPEAVRRWKYRIERAPLEAHGYRDAARAFEAMGEQAEAEAIRREAADRLPVREIQ